ncbi:MAG: hypothetical protein WCG97_03270 [bacterium]
MIKIQDTVKEVLYADEEALYALSRCFMNLSAYSKQIKKIVEQKTRKTVKSSGIVVALSRIQKSLKNINPMIQDIKIENITTKSPLSELVFEKNPKILENLSNLYKSVKTNNDDFLTTNLSSNEVSIICSDRIKSKVLVALASTPVMIQTQLASIGLSLDPKYYKMPNITYSLIRKIARKKILLAETITTHTEIIFVFHHKDLPEMMQLFEIN